jgi:hypothetical protein
MFPVIPRITLESLTTNAATIRNLVNNGFDQNDVQDRVEELYKNGVTLIADEVEHRQLLPGVLHNPLCFTGSSFYG